MKKLILSFLILSSFVLSKKIGDLAPVFYLRSIDKVDYFLTDEVEKNKPILLNFFATWCVPCRVELPLIDSLAYVYSDIDVVYIATGFNNKPVKSKNIKNFQKELNLTQTILLDKYGRVFEKYNDVNSLPLTVLLNEEGEIVYRSNEFIQDTSIINLSKAIKTSINEE